MTFSELALAPFVRLTIGGERLAIDLDRLLAERGLGPRNFVMDLTTWDGVKEAVRAGVGLAVCSRRCGPTGARSRRPSRRECPCLS
jgi:DNA-binding transcriptional LysR family regulator